MQGSWRLWRRAAAAKAGSATPQEPRLARAEAARDGARPDRTGPGDGAKPAPPARARTAPPGRGSRAQDRSAPGAPRPHSPPPVGPVHPPQRSGPSGQRRRLRLRRALRSIGPDAPRTCHCAARRAVDPSGRCSASSIKLADIRGGRARPFRKHRRDPCPRRRRISRAGALTSRPRHPQADRTAASTGVCSSSCQPTRSSRMNHRFALRSSPSCLPR